MLGRVPPDCLCLFSPAAARVDVERAACTDTTGTVRWSSDLMDVLLVAVLDGCNGNVCSWFSDLILLELLAIRGGANSNKLGSSDL
jgi:hypothetical protein